MKCFAIASSGNGYTLKDLKTAEDWILERQFKQVQGVIDVTSYGGETKQYHVEVDPYRMRGHGVSLEPAHDGHPERQPKRRRPAPLHGRAELRRSRHRLARVARARGPTTSKTSSWPSRRALRFASRTSRDVNIGHAPRLGIVGYNDDPDVVQGIVLMRYGGETPSTLDGIYKRVQYIRDNHVLPPGMDIEPYYDRGALVHVTTHTVLENLLVGMALVTLVLLLFLGHTRAALITAINIPLALLIAFCGLVGTHTSANLILVGSGRFRHRRRLDGHHDGKHLPASRVTRPRDDGRATSSKAPGRWRLR